MIKPCVTCKNQRRDNELRNIRGDDEVEGKILANFPEVLEIAENNVSFNISLIKLTKKNNNHFIFSQSKSVSTV